MVGIPGRDDQTQPIRLTAEMPEQQATSSRPTEKKLKTDN
jgi:hypothetical protein